MTAPTWPDLLAAAERVDAADLTDEQLEAIVVARRASPVVLAPQVLRPPDSLPWPTRPRRPWRKEPPREAPTRMCTRCGIDTTAPELCRDCRDVLSDEAAA
jgi:hypothetical protein